MMRRQLIFLVVCMPAAIGCGSGQRATYPVEGKVAFANGKALAGGTVELQSTGELPPGEYAVSARGQIEQDGTFTLSTFVPGDGAVAGKHRALVIPALPPGPIDGYSTPRPVIDQKFLRYDTSGLEFTVTSDGPNTFEITVTPPK